MLPLLCPTILRVQYTKKMHWRTTKLYCNICFLYLFNGWVLGLKKNIQFHRKSRETSVKHLILGDQKLFCDCFNWQFMWVWGKYGRMTLLWCKSGEWFCIVQKGDRLQEKRSDGVWVRSWTTTGCQNNFSPPWHKLCKCLELYGRDKHHSS